MHQISTNHRLVLILYEFGALMHQISANHRLVLTYMNLGHNLFIGIHHRHIVGVRWLVVYWITITIYLYPFIYISNK